MKTSPSAREPIRARVLMPLICAVLLAGCSGHTSGMSIEEVETLNGEPVILDPVHVQENAPVLYDLLEVAYDTGRAATSDDQEMQAILDYLRDVSGIFENTYVLEYRGKFFDLGTDSAGS